MPMRRAERRRTSNGGMFKVQRGKSRFKSGRRSLTELASP
jgi:hypothetical protein